MSVLIFSFSNLIFSFGRALVWSERRAGWDVDDNASYFLRCGDNINWIGFVMIIWILDIITRPHNLLIVIQQVEVLV